MDQRGRIIDELTEFIAGKEIQQPCDLVRVREEALKCIEKSQDYNLKYFLKHSIPARNYEVGDCSYEKCGQHRRH